MEVGGAEARLGRQQLSVRGLGPDILVVATATHERGQRPPHRCCLLLGPRPAQTPLVNYNGFHIISDFDPGGATRPIGVDLDS
jgi:hypothetical protein